MPAYLIVDTKISNPEAYEEYKALAKPLAEQFGGVYRVRGGAMEVIEGDLWNRRASWSSSFPMPRRRENSSIRPNMRRLQRSATPTPNAPAS